MTDKIQPGLTAGFAGLPEKDQPSNLPASEPVFVEPTVRRLSGDPELPRCDCGAELTQCSDCVVSEYQAAHPECSECCVRVGLTAAAPRKEADSGASDGAAVRDDRQPIPSPASDLPLRPLHERIAAWRDDEDAGYDQAIDLLCEAEAALREAQKRHVGLQAEFRRCAAEHQITAANFDALEEPSHAARHREAACAYSDCADQLGGGQEIR